jgi:hypothetical protein
MIRIILAALRQHPSPAVAVAVLAALSAAIAAIVPAYLVIVVVTHDATVGARLGRAVTIRDGRVGAEGRDGQDFAVVAGDGTVRLPPDVLGAFPPEPCSRWSAKTAR